MMIYLASDVPLPTIPWNESSPAFNVCALEDWGWGPEVRKQFTKRFVYYLGSYQRCGCGFGDLSENGKLCLQHLHDYLAVATNGRSVEMYSCWAGDESGEQLNRSQITGDGVLEPGFVFEEQQFLEVRSTTTT
jgi:hypothetical protein